jgi:hypothetical protein
MHHSCLSVDFIGEIGVLNFHLCDPLMYAFKHVEIRDTHKIEIIDM